MLLAKLNQYGIGGVSNDCCKSYLSNCSQYVSINGHESGLVVVNCGVPQGSVLGPLLFLGGAPTSICHFFCLSISPFICLSVHPSVAQHISGTIHHVIIIFGTLMQSDDISRCFFHFFKI